MTRTPVSAVRSWWDFPIPDKDMKRLGTKYKLGKGCWEWQPLPRRDGYGRFHYRGRDHQAHRFVYELVFGPIAPGMEVRHRCRNKLCVRPSHLELGTHSENIRDQVAHGTHRNARKTHCPQGHEYSEENTRRDSRGTRRCRACERTRKR